MDDYATVSVLVANAGPLFAARSYALRLAAGTDGSSNSASVGSVTATDPNDADTVTYSLRASGASTQMYAVGFGSTDTEDALYTVNSSTGAMSRVSRAENFGRGDFNSDTYSLAWHGSTLYMTSGTGRLYTIDITNGTASQVGELDDFGVGETEATGLASHDAKLYLIGRTTQKLYTVDTATGMAAAVNAGTVNFGGNTVQDRFFLTSHDSKLYTFNNLGGYLEELNATSGVATRVGSSTNFGVGESAPMGIASHGSSLYMIGLMTDSLYTLNATTGEATSVGTLTATDAAVSLATGYIQPSNLAIGASTGAITYSGSSAPAGVHTLYAQASDSKTPSGTADTAVDDTVPVLVDSNNRAPAFTAAGYQQSFAPGSDGSSTAITVSTVAASDPDGDTVSYSLRSSDPATRLYLVQDAVSHARDALFSVDSTTGAASRIAAVSNFGLGAASVGPAGLAWHEGRLYMIGRNTAALYAVDIAEGTAVRVGTATAFGVGETKPSGLAAHSGKLYMIGNQTDKLYTVETATGTAIAVGNSTDFGGAADQDRFGLASVSGSLFTLNDGGDFLETIDTSTGAARRVGATSQFGVSEGSARALGASGTTLYMGGGGTDALYTLDTSTGAATKAADFSSAVSDPAGIASRYVAPADFAVASATGAVTYTGSSLPGGTHVMYAQASDSKARDGTADTLVDDSVQLVVSAANAAPSFDPESFAFMLPSGADGSRTPMQIGSVTATDPENQTLSYSLRDSDPSSRLYLVGGTADALYRLESTSGVATRVGAADAFGVSETNPRGLTWHRGVLYMIGGATDGLYSLDTTTGDAKLVATRAQIAGTRSDISLSGGGIP